MPRSAALHTDESTGLTGTVAASFKYLHAASNDERGRRHGSLDTLGSLLEGDSYSRTPHSTQANASAPDAIPVCICEIDRDIEVSRDDASRLLKPSARGSVDSAWGREPHSLACPSFRMSEYVEQSVDRGQSCAKAHSEAVNQPFGAIRLRLTSHRRCAAGRPASPRSH